MRIAFCLYKYFPYGGLQRDFMRIALAVAARGHQVIVFTQSWQGERPDAFDIITVPVSSATNHGRNSQYYQWVMHYLQSHPVDRVVGFNKMPGLDVYYAADVCYEEKVSREKGFLYRLTRRYRHYAAFEKATFEQGANTALLMLTDDQIEDFKKHYQTEDNRFHILPPGIYPDRKYSQQINDSRRIYREKNALLPEQLVMLQVGSDFRRKGVERTLKALAALPEAVRTRSLLLVVGQDKPDRYQALAHRLGIADKVRFYAGRDDIAELMAAADLLLHPAFQEAAGIVLLEAIVSGLPLIVTEVCGYAHYVADAQCGYVIPEPFQQEALNHALASALQDDDLRAGWAQRARHFADTEDLYSLPERAADIILDSKYD